MELDGMNQAAYPPPPQASRLSSPQNGFAFPRAWPVPGSGQERALHASGSG